MCEARHPHSVRLRRDRKGPGLFSDHRRPETCHLHGIQTWPSPTPGPPDPFRHRASTESNVLGRTLRYEATRRTGRTDRSGSGFLLKVPHPAARSCSSALRFSAYRPKPCVRFLACRGTVSTPLHEVFWGILADTSWVGTKRGEPNGYQVVWSEPICVGAPQRRWNCSRGRGGGGLAL